MRKFLTILAATALMLSMAACGNNDPSSSTEQGGATIDDNGNAVIGTTIDGASAEVDMDKVEGTELKLDKKASGDTKAELGGLKVELGEAKIMDTEEGKLLILSFEFKNKTADPIGFDNIVEVEVSQNNSELRTTLVNGVEGINVRSGIELIDPGKSTVVQKAYPIFDSEAPVVVTAYKYGAPADDRITATFNLK